MNDEAAKFFSAIAPFSFLEGDLLTTITANLTTIVYPKDTVIFVQGAKVEHLLILKKGAAERYFRESGKKTLLDMLAEGDTFGGISILLNNSSAVRSLKAAEDTEIYRISKKIFMDICARHVGFREYFTDTFGKRMLNQSYAEILAKSTRFQDDGGMHIFNQPVSNIYSRNPVICGEEVSIRTAAGIMNKNRCGSILVKNKAHDIVGIATDKDFRTRVIAQGYDIEKPVGDIMSSPLASIPRESMVFEALMDMMHRNINHIAIKDEDGDIVGILSDHDMLTAQGHSPLFLTRGINNAENLGGIKRKYDQLPQIIRNQINLGAKAHNIARLITAVSDTILEKVIGLAFDDIGPPPAKFVFMVLGSEGRKEQTLKTDQDNAIIYEDVPETFAKTAHAYFLTLGEKVCGMLNLIGYQLCKGEVMARNPKWCQPLASWKKYFFDWIHAAEPEDLLQASIFFDFRGAYGDFSLVDDLQRSLYRTLDGWPGFFRHLSENALQVRLPLGFFRNFVVESMGGHRNVLDIKSAMVPIVDFARIYALKNKIPETNTMDRLKQLLARNALSKKAYDDLQQGYGFMMQLRIIRQIKTIADDGHAPDNYINPQKLSRLEQTMLKEIFKRLEKYQNKLSFDFLGGT